MKSFSAAVAVAAMLALTAAAQAQTPAAAPTPAIKTFASSAELDALVAQAKQQRREGQALVSLPMLRLAPYTARLDYRASVGPANLHEVQMELFYVVEGSATMVVGGALVDPKPANGRNMNGASVAGGESRRIARGDVLMVPPNTPHWFSAVDGLVVISVHTPAPVS
jgi:mannose-6-phosphate isomerase-like protein (cupin superfamily)